MLIKIIGLAWAFACLTVVGIILGAICCLLIRIVLSKKKTLNKEYSGNQKTIAFYLPFIDDLEDLKLLLFAFDSINNTIKHTKTEVAIYTYEERSVDQLLHFGYERYGVKHNIEFEISIKTFKNCWIINHYQNYHKSQFYKAICSIILIIEALTSYPPDIFIDLSGAEFAYPFAKAICPCIKILSCAQDVFIKSDGFSDRCQSEGTLKYSISTIIYMLAGYFCDQVLTNTEMLKEQFERIWSNSNVELLIPPCNITEFKQIDIAKSKENLIVSLCSFSDEEALKMQIRAFAYAKNSYVLPDNIHLYLICECDEHEEKIFKRNLVEFSKNLGIKPKVHIRMNLSLKEIIDIISYSKVGLYTSKNDRFVSSAIEMMAAGLVVIVNKSCKYLQKILTQNEIGYLASSEYEYSKFIYEAISYYEYQKHSNMREKARQFAEKNYNQSKFKEKFRLCFDNLYYSSS